MVSTEDILRKYSRKIEQQIDSQKKDSYSKDYSKFKQEMIPDINNYERWARSLGNFIHLKIAEKDRVRIQSTLDRGHIDVTPSQVITLALLSMLVVFFSTIFIAVAIYLITSPSTLSGGLVTFVLLGLIASMFIFYYTYSMPQRLANSWRLQASSQMVPAVLYTVVYMKHTSNLERAIAFAADHLEGPLALDFKKIFYNVEVAKYPTIKQSLDAYLEFWRVDAPEFIESFHLIESSLFETSETRRIQILEKSLTVILDGVYEKMLKYSREIRSPLTNIYMLGIILPTLALALLPLASTLLGGIIQWYHVLVIFNVIIPFGVFYLTSEVLLKRPGGYGESAMLELNPQYKQFASREPWKKAFVIAFPLFLIGIIPFILQASFITAPLGLQSDYTYKELGINDDETTKFFDFKTNGSSFSGPFGLAGTLFSFFIPLSIALFFAIAYNAKTKGLIKAREDTKILEDEFTTSLFQLGNRLGDGLPAEIAFSRVAESTQGQMTHRFFSTVNQNIQQMGMSLESAIFDKKRGALTYYPSTLIATSMKILVESVKKGLQIAAQSLMSISEYVKNIQKINQRLKDLLAEIVSDMKSNMTFLAPLLSGIVVGLSTMITFILNKLQIIQATQGANALEGYGSLAVNLVKLFQVEQMIPPYFLQISIGLYIIEIMFILTVALVTVDAGKDPLKEKYDLSKNLLYGISLYLVTALLATLALSFLASFALSSF
ncbi:hypothetical protein FJZ18_02710 [Candidatus Pacearchaeota archaeon]|nr:hypothetical protein [Candidatus Pacearchaeota archaeon]